MGKKHGQGYFKWADGSSYKGKIYSYKCTYLSLNEYNIVRLVRGINRQKKSILESLISKLSNDEINNLYSKKITGFSTWYKYKCIYFPNVVLKKLKEDCCDTCMKYQLALEDPNVVESDKALIIVIYIIVIINISIVIITIYTYY